MPSTTRLVRWALGGCALLASFYAGGVVGFNRGIRMQLAQSGDAAVSTVAVLRQLESGKIVEATGLLETSLDSQLALGLHGADSFCSPFNVPMRFVFPEGAANHARALSVAVEYRLQHPGPNAAVNERLLPQLRSYGVPPGRGPARCWPL